MAKRNIKFGKITWINIEKFDEVEEKYLKENYKFHPLTLKDCFDIDQNAKIDLYDNYLFLILHFPHLNKDKFRIGINDLAIFVGPDYFITVTTGKFKKLSKLFYLIQHNSRMRQDYMSSGVNFLFYKIVLSLFEKGSRPISVYLKQRIRDIENEIFEEGNRHGAVRAVALIRRNILNFRSALEPQKNVIRNLLSSKLIAEHKDYFDDINDYLEKLWLISSNYKELIDGFNEANESLISFRTNQIITTLTVISVALMPLTLFSSIYGMNIPLPYSDHPNMIWAFFTAVFALIIATLIFLKRKNRI